MRVLGAYTDSGLGLCPRLSAWLHGTRLARGFILFRPAPEVCPTDQNEWPVIFLSVQNWFRMANYLRANWWGTLSNFEDLTYRRPDQIGMEGGSVLVFCMTLVRIIVYRSNERYIDGIGGRKKTSKRLCRCSCQVDVSGDLFLMSPFFAFF